VRFASTTHPCGLVPWRALALDGAGIRAYAIQQEGGGFSSFKGVEHQIQNLVLRTQRGQETTSRQTPCLATLVRNCDHIATKPRVTGGDACPNRTGKVAVDQDQRGCEGISRTGGDG
jgi:hypothetical protein